VREDTVKLGILLTVVKRMPNMKRVDVTGPSPGEP